MVLIGVKAPNGANYYVIVRPARGAAQFYTLLTTLGERSCVESVGDNDKFRTLVSDCCVSSNDASAAQTNYLGTYRDNTAHPLLITKVRIGRARDNISTSNTPNDAVIPCQLGCQSTQQIGVIHPCLYHAPSFCAQRRQKPEECERATHADRISSSLASIPFSRNAAQFRLRRSARLPCDSN